MKIRVSEDASGVWIVTPTGLFDGDSPVSLALDAALFQQEKLPKPGTTLITSALFSLVTGHKGASNTCQLNIDRKVAAFNGQDYRFDVLASFDDFILKVSQSEGGGIRGGTTDLFRKLLANLMPATYAESLYFNYGYFRQSNPQSKPPMQSRVDLQAGMRLRLECQFSQLIPASTDPLVNGYVAGGQSYFQLVDIPTNTGRPQLGFDAFLGSNISPMVEASSGGLAGIIDLQGALARRRYFRLCYPAQFVKSDSAGFEGTAQNVTFIGADDLDTLNDATRAYFQTGSVSATGAVAAFFRGRTIAIPEILCFLNGNPIHVPIGTTVRQLFSTFTVLPRLAGFHPSKFPYVRYAPGTSFVKLPDDPIFPSQYRQVLFQGATVASGPLDAFDLPVLAGDGYTFDFATSD